MKKINLAITGCMGRMGQQLIKSSNKYKNFKLVNEADSIPGKGTLILEEISSDSRYEIIYHHYGVILQKN